MKKMFVVLILTITVGFPLSAQVSPWQAAEHGVVRFTATGVGRTPSQNPLLLIRVVRSGVANVGWHDPETSTAAIAEGGAISSGSSFEVYTGAGRWVAAEAGRLPANALSAGNGPSGRPVPILRVSNGGWLVPAAFSPEENAAVTVIEGRRMLFTTFEVLVPDWVATGDPNAVNQAFRSAADSDGSTLVPLRARQGRGLHLGKYSIERRAGYIPWGGREISVSDNASEVFIGTGVWRPVTGPLDSAAIPAGYGDEGEPLFMARAQVRGAQALGKYSARTNTAWVSYGGVEIIVKDFEVLFYDYSGIAESRVVLQETPLGSTAPSAFGANWLVNPGAEIQPVTGVAWTQRSGNWSGPKPGTAANSGQHIFWGGAHARAELFQDVPLAALGQWLSDGTRTAVFRGYLNSWSNDADSSEVIVEARGANGAVLASATTGTKNHDVWTLETLTLTLPAQTAVVRVRLIAVRVAGNDNNGYFDDLGLHLLSRDGIPFSSDQASSMASAPPSAATPSKATTPPAATPARINAYYGYYLVHGELTAADARATDPQFAGYHVDSYEYESVARERVEVRVERLRGYRAIYAPDKRVVSAWNMPGNVDVVLEEGVHTISLLAPPADLGPYRFELIGRGEQFAGKLDPFEDRGRTTREGYIYDEVRLDLQAGFWEFRIDATFPSRFTIRGADERDIESNAIRYDSELVVNAYLPRAGVYRLIIESEELVYGDWNLVINYGGGGR